ncbi:terpene synthase family protein [Streptomyces sp. NPDC048297]|uniref:terpene synthase family protein n=1 Tax=Streptomyces sp. NPDC048297 TaxID=3365531 RepID=UPI0037151645
MADLLDEETVRWAFRHNIPDGAELRTAFQAMHPGQLVARVAPRGRERELLVFADHHSWLFTFDDAYCDLAPRQSVAEWANFLAAMHRVAETGDIRPLPGNPYAVALRDIGARLSETATLAQRGEWVEALRSHFSALVWERATRQDGERPQTLDEYLLLRLRNGGMQSSLVLLGYVNGYSVAPEEQSAPAVRALSEMTATLVALDNDIFSHHKEASASCGEASLLDVLAWQQPHATPEAVLEDAVRIRNSIMGLFVRLRDEVAESASPALLSHLIDLGQWVRANLDFSLSTKRYAGPVADRARINEQPPQEAYAAGMPVESRVIGWWWDLPAQSPAASVSVAAAASRVA